MKAKIEVVDFRKLTDKNNVEKEQTIKSLKFLEIGDAIDFQSVTPFQYNPKFNRQVLEIKNILPNKVILNSINPEGIKFIRNQQTELVDEEIELKVEDVLFTDISFGNVISTSTIRVLEIIE